MAEHHRDRRGWRPDGAGATAANAPVSPYYGVLATGAALTNLAINAIRLRDVRATRHPTDDGQNEGA